MSTVAYDVWSLSDLQSKYVGEEKKLRVLALHQPLALYSVIAWEIASAVQQLDKPWQGKEMMWSIEYVKSVLQQGLVGQKGFFGKRTIREAFHMSSRMLLNSAWYQRRKGSERGEPKG